MTPEGAEFGTTLRRRTPVVPALLCFVALFLLVAYPYAKHRSASETFGFDLLGFAVRAVLAPLSIPALPFFSPSLLLVAAFSGRSALRAWQLPRELWLSGGCPDCAHPRTGPRCTECGRLHTPPVGRPSRALFRVAVLLTLAWLGGAAGAEVFALLDEAMFRRDARIQTGGVPGSLLARPRWWPMNDSMLFYSPRAGFTSRD